VSGFSIVTSGACLQQRDYGELRRAVAAMRAGPVARCASIGAVSLRQARELAAQGLDRLHHNLETSRRFFPSVCTTHTYAERVHTIRNARAAGLSVCAGGIFGLGESWEDRLSMALELRRLRVESVPINFLSPIPGTRLADRPLLSTQEALCVIALFRLVLPDRDIIVCGGRGAVLRDCQSWIFRAGANGMMVGGYLTTGGRRIADDIQMIRDAGFEPVGHGPSGIHFGCGGRHDAS